MNKPDFLSPGRSLRQDRRRFPGRQQSAPSHPLPVAAWLTSTICSVLLLVPLLGTSCGPKPAVAPAAVESQAAGRGAIEVTAQLVEIPDGAIFKRDLYDYATELKYKVIQVHRGTVHGEVIYVAHYNPFKPRNEAADSRVKEIGGNLKTFRAGQVHRLALEVPVEDHFMGGLVNKYFGTTSDPIYWAVWTDAAR
jgi:hypothetical protein